MAQEHRRPRTKKTLKANKQTKGKRKTSKQVSKGVYFPRFIEFIRKLGREDNESVGSAERMRAVGGLILFGISFFVFTTLVVYITDAKEVYSQLHSEDLIEAELGNQSVGTNGLSIGYTLFNGFLGWGSLLASITLPYIAIALLWMNRTQIYQVLYRSFKIILSSVWLGMILSTLQSLFGSEDSVLKWGGDLGLYYSMTLSRLWGNIGLAVFYLITFLILLVLFSERALRAVSRPQVSSPRLNLSGLIGLGGRKKADEEDDEDEDEDDEDLDEELAEREDQPEAVQPHDPQPARSDVQTIDLSGEPQTSPVIPTPQEPNSQTAVAEEATHELVVTVPQDELVEAEDIVDEYVPGMHLKYYKKPTIDLLEDYGAGSREIDREEIEDTKQLILNTLANFRIPVTPASATIGPTVTLYEIIPDQGVKISSIKGVENDLQLALKSQGIRIIAPMPGKGTVGIEVPNRKPQTVSMRSIMASQQFRTAQEKMELPVGIGKTITNDPFIFDLAKMPHILIAGATGQGKSVGLNALITSLLYSKRPEELKLVMVDPKMLEFSIYEDLEKHFMAMTEDASQSIITDMSKVVPTLNSLCVEMDNRFEKLARAKVRNIKDYNEQVRSGKLSRLDGFDFLPYIVLIVDEWADLIMTAGREAETPIARLAQKARAAGIHIVLATQRPSTDVVTGLIKANFPARIAFRVSSGVDSSTILGNPSAHHLIGRGDMLFFQGNELVRIQCAFMDTPETEAIVEHIARQESEGHAYVLPEFVPEGESKGTQDIGSMKKDEYFEEAARLVVSNQLGSASLLQRKMEVGFARAGRLMDQLEAAGIVGPHRGSKPRDVLVQDMMSLDALLEQLK